MVWYSHHLKNFTVSCDPHSQKLNAVNKAEVDIFLVFSCIFDDPADVGNLIFGSEHLEIHVLLKLCLENFEHYFASM